MQTSAVTDLRCRRRGTHDRAEISVGTKISARSCVARLVGNLFIYDLDILESGKRTVTGLLYLLLSFLPNNGENNISDVLSYASPLLYGEHAVSTLLLDG